ncbi:MAG: TSUP family transporter, partial [Alphaproteobacteria bacterium]
MDSAQQIFAGLDAPTLAYALVVIFVAAAVRGYSGFGASALIVTSLTLVLPPVEVVPISLLLEIAASLGLLIQVWKDVPWRTMAWLLTGAAFGMPAGFALLTALPADAMRVLISLLVLLACALIWRGAQASARPRGPAIFGTGVISGIANGTAAVGGLPVVLFFLYGAA